jgi:hypothetical protein
MNPQGLHLPLGANVALSTSLAFAESNVKQTFYSLCKRTVVVSVVYWSKFLAIDPEVPVRFPALPDFL